MAWHSDWSGFGSGSWLTQNLMSDLAQAVDERYNWLGSTPPGRATSGWWEAAWFNNLRSDLESIVFSFRNPSAFQTVSGQWSAFSKSTLLQYIYDNFGGESAGVYKSGSTYDWLRIPTRDGGPTAGAVQVGDWIYPEWLLAIKYACESLRWIQKQKVTFPYGHTTLVKAGTSNVDQQTAWNNMLAATPTQTYPGINRIGSHSYFFSPNYYAYDWKGVNGFQHYTTGTISAFASGGKISLRRYTGYGDYNGPYDIYRSNGRAATDYSGGTKLGSHTFAGTTGWEEVSISNCNVLAKDTSQDQIRVENPEGAGSTPVSNRDMKIGPSTPSGNQPFWAYLLVQCVGTYTT